MKVIIYKYKYLENVVYVCKMRRVSKNYTCIYLDRFISGNNLITILTASAFSIYIHMRTKAKDNNNYKITLIYIYIIIIVYNDFESVITTDKSCDIVYHRQLMCGQYHES